MIAPALIAGVLGGGGALIASVTDPAAGLTVYGPLGIFVVILVGVVAVLYRRSEKILERLAAAMAAERDRAIAELAAERADRKEAQDAVRAWEPLMTRAVAALESFAPLVETEVHLRADRDRHHGGD